MRKINASLLVTLLLFFLVSCTNTKEKAKYIREVFNIDEKLNVSIDKTIINTSYAWNQEKQDYRYDNMITTTYDSMGREIDLLHEIYIYKDNKWRGYTRYIFEYDDNTSSCYTCQYVPKRDEWYPEFKIITSYDDYGKIVSKENYYCSEYDSEDYESKFILNDTYEFIYDDNDNLITEIHNYYQGLETIFYYETTSYSYDDNNNLVLSELTRKMNEIPANDEDLKTTTSRKDTDKIININRIEYSYKNDLLVNKTVYLYDEISNVISAVDFYNYTYDDNGLLTKETKFINYSYYSGIFVEYNRKEYSYNGNKTIINEYHHNITSDSEDDWIISGKEEIITMYNN